MEPEARTACLADIRIAHQWVTGAMNDAQAQGANLRQRVLQQERKRLAGLYDQVKRGANPDGYTPTWRY